MSAEMWAQGCEKPIADALAYLGEYRSALWQPRDMWCSWCRALRCRGLRVFSAVAAAGEGLRTLAKGAAKQWGKDNLRVNTIALDPQHFVLGEIGEQLSAVMGLATSSGFGHKGDIAGDIATTLDWLTSEDAPLHHRCHSGTGRRHLDGWVMVSRIDAAVLRDVAAGGI